MAARRTFPPRGPSRPVFCYPCPIIFSLEEVAMKIRLIFSVFLVLFVFALGSASARNRVGDSNDYLALGDSVAFGYIDNAGYEYYYPTNFVGYADYTGLSLGLNLADGGCPGETTSGFISWTGSDNGCRPYRMNFPLHVVYGSATSPQLAYATSFLQVHPGTQLATIN